MSFDETFSEIELKRGDFRTDDQEQRANELLEEWPVNFTDLGELNGVNWRDYREVYELYTSPPGATLTVKELEEVFDTLEEFERVRDSDLMRLFEDKAFNGRIGDWKDAFQSGYDTGYENGWNAALEKE